MIVHSLYQPRTLSKEEATHPTDVGVFDPTAATPRRFARAQLAALFTSAGLPSPDLDARLLVCAACGIDHAGLIRDPDLPLGGAAQRLDEYAARRLAGEPVSRILRRREFWGMSFAVTPAVLDPRPETEGLVASVLDALGGRRDDALAVLDLGVGSGAILAALIRELPGAYGIGIDRSHAACRIARDNLRSLGFGDRAAVLCADWADPLQTRFDVVVSNPPYIATPDLAGLMPDVREYDPLAALDGGDDGLAAYRILVPGLDALLRPAGVAAFECGSGQGLAVADMMRGAGLADAAVYRDLAGHDRVVIGSARP